MHKLQNLEAVSSQLSLIQIDLKLTMSKLKLLISSPLLPTLTSNLLLWQFFYNDSNRCQRPTWITRDRNLGGILDSSSSLSPHIQCTLTSVFCLKYYINLTTSHQLHLQHLALSTISLMCTVFKYFLPSLPVSTLPPPQSIIFYLFSPFSTKRSISVGIFFLLGSLTLVCSK